jgi:hypothetical protein
MTESITQNPGSASEVGDCLPGGSAALNDEYGADGDKARRVSRRAFLIFDVYNSQWHFKCLDELG